jgi:hypothetical protein
VLLGGSVVVVGGAVVVGVVGGAVEVGVLESVKKLELETGHSQKKKTWYM